MLAILKYRTANLVATKFFQDGCKVFQNVMVYRYHTKRFSKISRFILNVNYRYDSHVTIFKSTPNSINLYRLPSSPFFFCPLFSNFVFFLC